MLNDCLTEALRTHIIFISCNDYKTSIEESVPDIWVNDDKNLEIIKQRLIDTEIDVNIADKICGKTNAPFFND